MNSKTCWSATTSASGRYGGCWRGTERARIELELAVDTQRAARLGVGGDRVELGQQVGVGRAGLRSRARATGSNQAIAANGVRSSGRTSSISAVDVGAVEAAVDGDHLAVERVQRAEAEVAVLGQLLEGHVALEGALEQGADRRRLEEHVRLVLGVQVAMAQGLDVQVAGEPLVEHH